MSIPSRVVIEIPLLTALTNHDGQATPSVIYEELAERFELTEEDLKRLTNDGAEPVWYNTVRQARRTLVEKREIDNSTHGVWQITKAGYDRLHTHQIELDNDSTRTSKSTHESIKSDQGNDTELTAYIPEEISLHDVYREGAKQQICVNSYERNPVARKECIEHYGTRCYICKFDFASKYGVVGKGLIHVHHLLPLYELGEEYTVDPVADLRPVCPNCHAIIHQRRPAYSIEEVRAMLHECSE